MKSIFQLLFIFSVASLLSSCASHKNCSGSQCSPSTEITNSNQNLDCSVSFSGQPVTIQPIINSGTPALELH